MHYCSVPAVKNPDWIDLSSQNPLFQVLRLCATLWVTVTGYDVDSRFSVDVTKGSSGVMAGGNDNRSRICGGCHL